MPIEDTHNLSNLIVLPASSVQEKKKKVNFRQQSGLYIGGYYYDYYDYDWIPPALFHSRDGIWVNVGSLLGSCCLA